VTYINHMKLLRHDLYIEPARSDHARSGHGCVLATAETIGIMKRRYGDDCAGSFQPASYGEPVRMADVTFTFHPAGHILGSAQILLEWKGQRIVVSGDYKRSDDGTCPPFQPISCDIFITEATFALPVFQHPDPKQEIARLLSSLHRFPEQSHMIAAYPLGKAQRLIKLLRLSGYDDPIYLHGAMTGCCDYYQESGVDLGDLRKATGLSRETLKGRIVIAPPSALKEPWSRRMADPVLGQASGWMTVKQRVRQSGVELPLVISDHADWNELTRTILDTGAGEIWVTHGREDALVYWCRKQGLKAAPLHLQGRDSDEGDAG
jgi:putative mRNA 3-end processing factor